MTLAVQEDRWTTYRSQVPESQRGDWRVERFEVPKDGGFAFTYGARAPRPGIYTRLVYGSRWPHTVMSDTPAELRDLLPLKCAARGLVLINGLGLGIAADLCQRLDTVAHVTVIERSLDVIALVAPTLANPKLTIIHADAFTWVPPRGTRYDAVWHDIWPSLCADHLPEMSRLHRRYGRRAAWQGSWCRAEMEAGR
jgi:hypothetical protein